MDAGMSIIGQVKEDLVKRIAKAIEKAKEAGDLPCLLYTSRCV